MHLKRKKTGMTLTEVMLAMALLASAFIPIIGVMGSSIKATEKDDSTIKAVNLCQEKLNRALQFDFDKMPVGSYGGAVAKTLQTSGSANGIVLTLGPEAVNGIQFTSKLDVTDAPGTFLVWTYDAFAKGQNPADPTKWGWVEKKFDYANLFHKYVLTVTWKEKGSAKDKFYTLASHKAKIRR
ncbi:MAG TPA: prepilin-type N-terminal cleavage/methylation domain-containing protein [Candidatus Rifleibacterium sp.]|nr:prepilin-type N-terminal cleavage/methylation domain-containing protein [Candidatus Rifleibacterium sp.]HPT45702.1 prepilin-type N-terminal cleavage/methylation domain-containing protein [Candidatus Rifleibacterium sp.]